MSLYTVFYLFSLIGQILYGGEITTESAQVLDVEIPPLYYLMNFNDFPASMVTLFHIMIVNNWFITCNMLCEIKGSALPRMFFTSFWVLTVLIMLNLVISFILEIYSDTEGEVALTYAKLEAINKFKELFNEVEVMADVNSSDDSENDNNEVRSSAMLDLLEDDSGLEVKTK